MAVSFMKTNQVNLIIIYHSNATLAFSDKHVGRFLDEGDLLLAYKQTLITRGQFFVTKGHNF